MKKFFFTLAALIIGLLPALAQDWVAVTPTGTPIEESSIPSTGLVLEFTLTHPTNAKDNGEFYAVYGPKLTFAGTSLAKSDFSCVCVDGSEKATVTVKKSVFTKAGDLVITFAEGNYCWTPTSGYFLDANEGKFTYSITTGAPVATGWSATPETGSEIDMPSASYLDLVFTLPSGTGYNSTIYEVVKMNGTELIYGNDYVCGATDNTTYKIQVYTSSLKAGTLTVTLPANMMGSGSPAYDYSITIKEKAIAAEDQNVWISQTDEALPIDITTLSSNGLELKYTVNPPSQYTCTGYGFDDFEPTATINGKGVTVNLAKNETQKFFIVSIDNRDLEDGELIVNVPNAFGYWWCNAPEGYLDTPAATFKYTLTGGGDTPTPGESTKWTSDRPEDMDIQLADLGSAGLMLSYQPTPSPVAGETVLSFDASFGTDCVVVKMNDNVIANRVITEDETNKYLDVKVPKDALEAGTLTVTIKEAYAYWYNASTGSYTDVPEAMFTYTVVAPAATPTSFNILPNPAAGTELVPYEVLNDGKSVRYAVEITSDLEGNPSIKESMNIYSDVLIENDVLSFAYTVDELTDKAWTYKAVDPNPMGQAGTWKFVFQLPATTTDPVTLDFPAQSWATTQNPIIECNAAQFKYTLAGLQEEVEVPYYFSPANGASVNALANTYFYVTFPDAAKIELNSDAELEAKDADGATTVPSYAPLGSAYINYNTARFRLPSSINGWYEVSFPEGTFKITDAEGNTTASVPFTWKGVVDTTAPEYIVSPAAAYVKELPFTGPFSVNFLDATDAENITFSDKVSVLSQANVVYNGRTLKYGEDYFESDESVTKFNFDETINEPGIVTVNFPAGFWTVDGVESPAISWTFGLNYPAVTTTFAPANNESVETLSQFTVTFGPEASVSAIALNAEKAANYTIAVAEQTLAYGTDFTIDVEGLTATVKFNNPVTYKADVVAPLPNRLFEITRPSGVTYSLPKAYTVKVSGLPQTYTLTPEAGAYEVYPAVTIVYDNCTSVAINEGAVAKLYIGSVNAMSEQVDFTITTDGVNTVTLTPSRDYTTPPASEYTKFYLTLSAGALTLDLNGTSVPNNALQITDYITKTPPAPEWTATPLNEVNPGVVRSVDDLLTLTISLPENYRFQSLPMIALKSVWLQKEVNGTWENAVKFNNQAAISDNGNNVGFTLTTTNTLQQTGDGLYKLVIPANYAAVIPFGATTPRFTYGALEFNFTVDANAVGVNGINATDLVDVYTATGICVARQANREVLSTLAPGIYIVNGKKVAVK